MFKRFEKILANEVILPIETRNLQSESKIIKDLFPMNNSNEYPSNTYG